MLPLREMSPRSNIKKESFYIDKGLYIPIHLRHLPSNVGTSRTKLRLMLA